jgi:hypothetical protein
MEFILLLLAIVAVLGLFDAAAMRAGSDSRILPADRTPRQEL